MVVEPTNLEQYARQIGSWNPKFRGDPWTNIWELPPPRWLQDGLSWVNTPLYMAFWMAFPWGCNNNDHLGWNRNLIFTTWVGLDFRPPQRFIVMTCSVCTSVSGLGTLAVGPPTPFCGGHNSAARLAALSRISCHQNSAKKPEVVINQYFWGCYILLLFNVWVVPEVVKNLFGSVMFWSSKTWGCSVCQIFVWDSWL